MLTHAEDSDMFLTTPGKTDLWLELAERLVRVEVSMRNARIKHQAGCDSEGALYTEKPTFINNKAPMKRTEKAPPTSGGVYFRMKSC